MFKPEEYEALLPHPLPLYDYHPLSSAQRGLVIGMGGGCDIFAAYAIAQQWSQACERAGEHPQILYSSVCGEKHISRTRDELPQFKIEELQENASVYTTGPVQRPLEHGEEGYGTIKLELSVPRGPGGSPLVFALPKFTADSQSEVKVQQEKAAEVIARALEAASPVDYILAVDAGGDSITGGTDWSGFMELGRDRLILNALKAKAVSFDHLVLGPACDGESSEDEMRESLQILHDRGHLKGCMDVAPIADCMQQYTLGLMPTRTPNILWRGCERRRLLKDASQLPDWAKEEALLVVRHENSRRVPWTWLTIVVVIKGAAANDIFFASKKGKDELSQIVGSSEPIQQ